MQRAALWVMGLMGLITGMSGASASGTVTASATAATPSATDWRVEVLNPHWRGGIALPADRGAWLWGSDAMLWRLRGSSPASTSSTSSTSSTLPSIDGDRELIDLTHTGAIHDLALLDHGQQAVIAGADGLLMFSEDGGTHWQSPVISGATSAESTTAIAARSWHAIAHQGRDVLVIGDQGALLLSRDAGRRWQVLPMPTDASSSEWTAVASDGRGQWWLASAQGQVWHTAAETSAWRSRSLGAGIDALVADTGRAWAATRDGRLWSIGAEGPPGAGALRADMRVRARPERVHRIQRVGTRWVAFGERGRCLWWRASEARRSAMHDCQLPTTATVLAMSADAQDRRWLAAGEGGLLMVRETARQSWRPVRDDVLANLQVRGRHLQAVVASGDRWWVAGEFGVVLQADASARRWRVVHSAPAGHVHEIADLGQGRLVAGLTDRWMARSDDQGRHWRSHQFQQLEEPAYLFRVKAVGRGVVVGGGHASVLASADGQHWRSDSLGDGADHLEALVAPDRAEVWLFGSGGLVTQVDAASARWQRHVLDDKVTTLWGGLMLPRGPLLFGEQGRLTWRDREGDAWLRRSLGGASLHAGALTPDGEAVVLVGDGGQVWRVALQDGQPTGAAEPLRRLEDASALGGWRFVRRSADGQHLMIGSTRGALWRSDRSGTQWEAVDVGTTSGLRAPVWEAPRRRWWMPGRDGLLLSSADDGASWQRVFTRTREHLRGVVVEVNEVERDGVARSGLSAASLLLYGDRLVRLTPRRDATPDFAQAAMASRAAAADDADIRDATTARPQEPFDRVGHAVVRDARLCQYPTRSSTSVIQVRDGAPDRSREDPSCPASTNP